MVHFKIISVLLVYVYVNSVSCGRRSYHPDYDGIMQSEHSLRKRAAFLKPLKHVLGHIAERLDVHHGHSNCDFKHLHRHPDFSHTPYHGHEFRKDFTIEHEPGWFHNSPPPPVNNKNPHTNFHNFEPSPDVHLYYPPFSFDEHPGFRKDKPDQNAKNPKDNGNASTDLRKKQDTENQANTSPKNMPEEVDNDYPINDFDKNRETNGKNPFDDVNGTVNLESDFSGTDNEEKNRGQDNGDWVVGADDEMENTGNGQIPSTSQIDIRFRKN